MRPLLTTLAVLAVAAVAGPSAGASEFVDRNATNVRLQVNAKGEALLSYVAKGKQQRVLVWGAVNAIAPTRSRAQVSFRTQRDWSRPFTGSCGRYDGPKLPWLVVACKAPDGSYWAVQSWQRLLPSFGGAPSGKQADWELHLSHWTGELPKLDVKMDWAWRKWDHLYGTFIYRGAPVYGFSSSPGGEPLDSFGRTVVLDTFGSAYGPGWRRENAFPTHADGGTFCYSLNPHKPKPAGTGKKYRATSKGPGVTPLVMWEGASPGRYEHEADLEHNRAIAALGDRLCTPN